MADQDWVELKHPDVEATYTAHPDSVEFWKRNGWTEVSKTEQKKAANQKQEGSA